MLYEMPISALVNTGYAKRVSERLACQVFVDILFAPSSALTAWRTPIISHGAQWGPVGPLKYMMKI